MKCRLCGKKLAFNEYRKHICRDCIEKLPKCLQENIHEIDIEEAKRIIAKFHSLEDFSDPDHYEIWFSYGDIGITTTGVVIEKRHIILFKDIKNFYFDYLPRRSATDKDMCFGEFSFNFELSGIPYEFRTLALRCGTTYRIEKEKFYPSFSEKLIKLVLYIKQGVSSKEHCLKNEKVKYEEEYKAGYHTWRKGEQYSKATNNEKSKRENSSRSKEHHQQNRNEQRSYSQNQTGMNELTEALKFFCLSIPYTEKELKTVYRNLIRQCHPDQLVKNQSLKPEDVNRCYGILKKYAT